MGWVNLFSDHSHNHMTLLFLLLLSTPQQLLGSIFGYNMYYLLQVKSVTKTGCVDRCGETMIPYPFGMRGDKGPNGCYYNDWYEIVCNTSFNPPRPFLSRLNLEVMGVMLEGDQFDGNDDVGQAIAVRTKPHDVCSSTVTYSKDLRGSPYRFSAKSNVFVVQGCSGITVTDRTGNFLTACGSTCLDNSTLSCDYRSGIGCCHASLGTGITDLDFYKMTSKYEIGSGCNTKALLLDKEGAIYDRGNLSNLDYWGTILQWRAVGQLLDTRDHANFSCDSNTGSCSCKAPYAGNPYLPHGCKVDCVSYSSYHQCKRHHLLKMASILGSSIGIGLVLLASSGYFLYKFARRKIEIKRKSKYFKKNGGLLLQQQISSPEGGVVDKTKLFTLTELERATNNFNENRILGQGGQGTVYKGMMEDGNIVAIKKSRKVNENQVEQFINEVVIVSQINHRNVVKLLGCCLETEVPLLVYEFVPNGALYRHLHYPSEDFYVTWKMRLQIAAQSACALAYLHSSTSPPIFHRDIKSSNILLDDKFRAKVSDFGTSKAIDIDQTHVTTCVHGTYGYLDPEYFQSNQFTEKSDVYSFGVVLVELITGKKPVYQTKSGGWISLASEFLYHMKSCTLDDILDPRVLKEGGREDVVAIAKLARQCLKRNGRRRPTMKEVAKVLEEINSPKEESVKNDDQFSCTTIETENMSLPDVHMEECLSIQVEPLILNTM